MKKLLYLIIPAAIIAAPACKKDENKGQDPPPEPPASKIDLLKDSVYLYSKEIYFWHEVIPAYNTFNPRKYTGNTELQAAQNVMAAIRNLQPQDKKHGYSFVTTQAESDGIQTGEDKDYGFFIKAATFEKIQPVDSVHWYVEYVYQTSPSGAAAVERGWYINRINGTEIGYDNASVDILNNVFFGSTNSAEFQFVKQNGDIKNITLTKATFTANAVLHTSVITDGAKKTGYLVFNQFFGEGARTELRDAFADFSAKGINELIVDLRYNPGGSTETQNVLANLIAPQAADGQKMYTYDFNDSLKAGKFPLLRRKPGFSNITFAAEPNTVKYEKEGSLNLSRVFFIVTGGSASASELVINNLRPYMEVKLVGDTTYGKPVGFFPISVFGYAIYPISFKTINAAGAAEYYDGFAPDKLAADGVNTNWGDTKDPSLAAALKYISTGSFGRVMQSEDDRRAFERQQLLQPVNIGLSDKKFSGMYVENKK